MYKCLCCGNETLPVPPEEAIAYICPVCWWENDVFLSEPNEPSDENHGLTLLEAHENYLKYGVCDPSPRLWMCSWKATLSQADLLLGDHAPFLARLEESPDNELYIKLYAAETGKVGEEIPEGVSQPVAEVLSKTRPIRPGSRVIHLRFDSTILYQVRNESFCLPDRAEVRHGRYLAVCEKSRLLDMLPAVADVHRNEDGSWYPGPWTHYLILTQNQIIDVISHVEPRISVSGRRSDTEPTDLYSR